MNETLVLQDPQSGVEVRIKILELPQLCSCCGLQMDRTWGISADGSPWQCLGHHVRLLLSFSMSEQFKAQARARLQLSDVQVGDQVAVTQEMLTALGKNVGANHG